MRRLIANAPAVLAVSLMLALPTAAADECAAPEKFAEGVASSPRWDWRLTFEPSRRTMYWAHTQGWWPATRERATILTSRKTTDGWSAPEVASFSGVHSDMDPAVSPNGRTLFFSSERPRPDGRAARMDLWMVERHGRDWGEPVHLGDAVNSTGDELYASVDRHGTLYWASNRDGEFDIYRSRRERNGQYAVAEKVPGLVNSRLRWEFNPEISPDGRTLLFVRLDLPDALPDQGYGFGDIYASRLADAGFEEPVNLGPCINTAGDEFHPTVLWERKLLFFAKDLGRPSDFYVAPLVLPWAK
ncbi:PD40 domain-containing protein [Cognatilysobacter bugurensis]|uniref:Exo-alpha-sialidase n=1 Tax=Cognatilysobacter bugurensis TaxID=543356 RepID=A0A918SV76_9GAMM|nr:PD40 domain-containing protein [Lysobacter bugurensis]GHA72419.1 hypothetical protein GCM10007067_06140 [Lysobacter bugurensis]